LIACDAEIVQPRRESPDRELLLYDLTFQDQSFADLFDAAPEQPDEAQVETPPDWAPPLNALSLNSLIPSQGSVEGGVRVRVVGTGFQEGIEIFLGDAACEELDWESPSHIRCTTPSHPAGRVDVYARFEEDGNLREYLLEDGFSFFEPLELSTISPTRGPLHGGTSILLEGNGLTEETQIRIGGRRVSEIHLEEDGRLSGRTPPGEQGWADLSIVNPNGSAILPHSFFYYGDLNLEQIEPALGPLRGGLEVQLRGVGLLPDTEVLFGEREAELLQAEEDHSALRLRLPPGEHPGLVDLRLQNENGQLIRHQAFLYYEEQEGFSVAGLSPGAGPSQGEFSVILAGSGFEEGIQLFFDGEALECNLESEHQLRCLVPPHDPGVIPVSVRQGDQRTLLEFHYHGQLNLTGLRPDRGSIAGGTWLLVQGEGFDEQTQISLGEQPLLDQELQSETEILGRSPASTVGRVDVRASQVFVEALLPEGFRYFDPSSRFGGLWGEPIQGAVNVTVFNEGSGAREPEVAILLLSDDGRFELEGLTDGEGRLTLSALGLTTPISLTAAKEGFAATTVEGVQVENVSIYLEPNEGEGGPPGGDELAVLSGTMSGLDLLPKPREENKINVVAIETSHSNPYNRSRLPDPGMGGLLTEDGAFQIQARAGELALIATAGEVERSARDAYLAGELEWMAFRRRFRPIAMGIHRFISASPGLEIGGLHVRVDHMMDLEIPIDLDNPPLGPEPGPQFYAVLPRISLGAEGYWEPDTDAFGIIPSLLLSQMPSLDGWDPDIRYYLIGFAFSATADNRPYSVSIKETREVDAGIFISPFVATPFFTSPQGDLPLDRQVSWGLHEGFDGPIQAPSAHLVEISEPAFGPPKPLWRYITPGDVTEFQIPRLPEQAGESGLGRGLMYLDVIPFQLEDHFEFDDFTYDAFNQLHWKSWAEAHLSFQQ